MDEVTTNSYVDIYAIYSSKTDEIIYIPAKSVTGNLSKLTIPKSQG